MSRIIASRNTQAKSYRLDRARTQVKRNIEPEGKKKSLKYLLSPAYGSISPRRSHILLGSICQEQNVFHLGASKLEKHCRSCFLRRPRQSKNSPVDSFTYDLADLAEDSGVPVFTTEVLRV